MRLATATLLAMAFAIDAFGPSEARLALAAAMTAVFAVWWMWRNA